MNKEYSVMLCGYFRINERIEAEDEESALEIAHEIINEIREEYGMRIDIDDEEVW